LAGERSARTATMTETAPLFCAPVEFVSHETMNNALDDLAVEVSFVDGPDVVGVWTRVRPSPSSGEEMFELREVIGDRVICRTFVGAVTKVVVP
jgi:hypothetical protein